MNAKNKKMSTRYLVIYQSKDRVQAIFRTALFTADYGRDAIALTAKAYPIVENSILIAVNADDHTYACAQKYKVSYMLYDVKADDVDLTKQ